jgi:hypothetical protein
MIARRELIYLDDFDSEDLLESLFPKSRGVVIAAQRVDASHCGLAKKTAMFRGRRSVVGNCCRW